MEGMGHGSARHGDGLGHRNNPPPLIDPDDVERDQRVLHPERVEASLIEDEERASFDPRDLRNINPRSLVAGVSTISACTCTPAGNVTVAVGRNRCLKRARRAAPSPRPTPPGAMHALFSAHALQSVARNRLSLRRGHPAAGVQRHATTRLRSCIGWPRRRSPRKRRSRGCV